MITKHFYCCATDANGDNLDWFVEAHTPQEALELWNQMLDENGFELEEHTTATIFQLPPLTGFVVGLAWLGHKPKEPALTRVWPIENAA